MTYIEEISGALVRVLMHACDGPPQRFAGYAANAEFWVGEARHCLDVIRGYKERFERLRQATAEYPSVSDEWGHNSDKRTTRSTKQSDLSFARRQVTDAARRFIARCEKMKLISNDEVIKYAECLSIQLPL